MYNGFYVCRYGNVFLSSSSCGNIGNGNKGNIKNKYNIIKIIIYLKINIKKIFFFLIFLKYY